MPLEAVILTASGPMGADELKELGLDHLVVYEVQGKTDGNDTTKACQRFLAEKVDLVVFCGGDGTAIDVMDAVDGTVPVIGIPSGVKMHSGVFATTPRTAGELLRRYLDGSIGTKEGEVMDIDEEAFRSGRLQATLEGLHAGAGRGAAHAAAQGDRGVERRRRGEGGAGRVLPIVAGVGHPVHPRAGDHGPSPDASAGARRRPFWAWTLCWTERSSPRT